MFLICHKLLQIDESELANAERQFQLKDTFEHFLHLKITYEDFAVPFIFADDLNTFPAFLKFERNL